MVRSCPLLQCKKATENDEGPRGLHGLLRQDACYLGAKIATRTINGMYVINDTTAMTRHRKRHILASDMEGVGNRGGRREAEAYHVLSGGHRWLPPFRHPPQFLSLGHGIKGQRSTKQGIIRNQRKSTMLVLVNLVRLLSRIEGPRVCRWVF